MRAPALLTKCLPGLVPHDRVCNSTVSLASDNEMHLSSPAVEILPSKMDWQGVNLLKGIVSVSDILGLESASSKPDASLKYWDNTFDLVGILNIEIMDAQLSFRGKRVLELGSGYGVPGVFACLKGASTVHFHNLNAETIRCTTIPNVMANLEQARERQSQHPESPLTPSRQSLSPIVNFYAGDWEDLSGVLSVVKNNVPEASPTMNSEDDFVYTHSSHDGSISDHETSSRQSRRLSGSRVCEGVNDTDVGGYDVILLTAIPHSATSLKKLYALIKKCLKPSYGVLFVATRKQYVGFHNSTRQLRNLIDEEDIFGAHLFNLTADTEIWKFFLK